MTKDDFIRGDVVQLKSGGPAMTVKIEWPFVCIWFNANKELCQSEFNKDVLKKI